MLGKRSLQENLFNTDNQYLSFVGRDSFYGYLAAHRHELFRDEDFAFLYCADNGRTSVPPSLLACALLLQWYENVSDQEATDRAKYDLRWKVALGLKMEEEPFAKSTLQLLRTQLIVHKQARKLFETSLAHARQQRYFKSPKLKAVLDTTPIFGKGAVQDTYNLLAESLRQVLRVLAELEEKEFDVFACEHDFPRYTAPSFKGSVAIDWDNEVERQAVLTALVADCDRVLALARTMLTRYADSSDEAQRIIKAVELLSKILAQDVQRTPDPPEPLWRAGSGRAGTPVVADRPSGEAHLIQGVAKDRIVSVHDPEMRHGRKSASQRFDGYKAAIAVDADSKVITAVDVLAGNAHDAENAQTLIEQTEENTQTAVETIIADTAYGSVEQRIKAQTDQRSLVAPVPKPPQTGRFTKEDFQIGLAQESVTCPAGRTTTQWYLQKRETRRGTRFMNKAFRFSEKECQECALRAQCVKPGARWRTVTVHEHEALLHEAKQFQRTEHFRELYRQRAKVEHRIARLVQLGLRKARYFGSAKVLFQLAMTAAVANLTLIAASGTTLSPFSLLFVFLLASTLALLWRASAPQQRRSVQLCAKTDFLFGVSKNQNSFTKTPTFRLCF